MIKSGHGLRITKIHRYCNSCNLCGFASTTNSIQILEKNEFEKNLFKLMNNMVFGKIMENVRNYIYINVQYIMRWDGRYDVDAMIVKPNFHRSVFSRNLVAIKMLKLEMKFDKPIYQISWVYVSSDISKTCLYEFPRVHVIALSWKIMYTDTDSLIYHIEWDNLRCYETRYQ